MKIYNYLPIFSECMMRWKKLPAYSDFYEQYFSEIEAMTRDIFDGPDLYSALGDLDWSEYRERVIRLHPENELARLEKNLSLVEQLFQLKLQGEIVLFGSFETIDGYARFERGSHRVFLGVDESFEKGSYLDILQTHELTHVVRESRPQVWAGFGLKLEMTHDEFTQNLPVIEHLFSEGWSCTASELLVPDGEPWHFAYQEEENLPYLLKHKEILNSRVHLEIRKDQPTPKHPQGGGGDYSHLYQVSRLVPPLPPYAHYYWAWQWTRQVLKDFGQGDPKKVVSVCSKEFVEHALAFKI